MFVRRSTTQIPHSVSQPENKIPTTRVLVIKADVSDAFQNVIIDLDEAHTFCYTVGELIVIDFRLTLGWPGSPGLWGVMSAAAEHAHCNTTLASAQILGEGADTMAHVKMVDRWQAGNPTTVPADAEIKAHPGGGVADPFFATVYADYYLLVRVQHSDHDTTVLTASASLASDHVRLFGPGEAGVTPILAPRKSTEWDTTIDALGYTLNSHTTRISLTRENFFAIERMLADHWPTSRRYAKARNVLCMAGKLWNLAYVVRAGR